MWSKPRSNFCTNRKSVPALRPTRYNLNSVGELEKVRKLSQEGNLQGALEIYDALLQRSADPEIAWKRVGLLRDMGGIGRAHRALLKLLETNPENPRWLNALGVLEADAGRSIDGITTLSGAVQILAAKPAGGAVVRTNLAALYFESGWLEDGLFHAKAALAVDRDMRRAHFLIGLYAPTLTTVDPAEVFKSDARLHLHPYLNFDVEWKETRWILPIRETGEKHRRVQTDLPSPESEGEFRFSLGAKVIAGVALEEAFYGTVFKVMARDNQRLSMAALREPVLLTRIQRRSYVRAYRFDPIRTLFLKTEEGWAEVPKSGYTVLDVSASGMRLSFRRNLSFNQKLRVTFELENEDLETEATVTRMEPDQVYGVQFLIAGEREVERLHKVVFQVHLQQARRIGRP